MPKAKTFATYFDGLPDPRVPRCRAHELREIIVIAVLSLICGGKGWEDMTEFATAKLGWLRERLGLELAGGIPCPDTFRRVFERLDPQAFASCMRQWTSAAGVQSQGRLLSLDGKTLRHSFDGNTEAAAIHMVRVWAAANRLVIGALPTDAKSNEIPAARSLLALLDLRGAIVSADAEHAQKQTVRQIRQQAGDYVIGLKDNQPTLRAAVASLFEWLDHPAADSEWAQGAKDRQVSRYTQHDKGHGRFETRQTTVVTLPEQDPVWQDFQHEWEGLRTLVRVVRTRREGQHESTEPAYFISSVLERARRMGALVRAHWGIENRAHHVLDVTFREDDCRIRRANGPANLAVLRDAALNALNRMPKSDGSIRRKQTRAGWNDGYLSAVVAAIAPLPSYC